jgi:hypothetical protein
MKKCACCFSPATQLRGSAYHCDCCAEDYDVYESYRSEGQSHIVSVNYSGYLGLEFYEEGVTHDP